jgi:chromosome segregation protein
VFLKSLDLLGFKSFAEKTHLEFSGGITALLGPNGCGKSNVVDAVKWVLGEQSHKTLRAGRMEDVIFSGTENRKALSVAEVTLLMSNEEEQLPLGVPEVAIKRRLYRSGESEYLINNHAVRLRDVRELFFDTGVGKSAYSIMEQGEIDQVLSTKPEERRVLFEEAAGITKFRSREVEAQRKLEKTRENMRQVEGILGEVRRSYNSLKIQAEKTETYRRLRDELFELELNIQLLRLRGFLEQRDQTEGKLAKKTAQRDRLKQKIDKINAAMEQGLDQVNSMETRLVDNQKRLYRIDLEKNNKESQAKLLKERVGAVEGKIKSDREREQSLNKKLENSRAELRTRMDELEQLRTRLEEVDKNIRDFERDIRQFEERVGENEQEILRLGREVLSLEGKTEELRQELRHLTDDIVTQLDQRLKELGYSAQERKQAEEKIQAVFEGLKIQLNGRMKLLSDLRSLDEDSRQGRERVLQTSLDALGAALEKIGELDALFLDYRRFTPSFLEEFLTPEGIITRKRGVDQQITATLEQIANARQRGEALQEENRNLSGRIVEYRKTLEELRVNHARMLAQKSNLENEMERLNREILEQESQLSAVAREIEQSLQAVEELEERIARVLAERDALEKENQDIKRELSSLEGRIASKNSSLVGKEKELKNQINDLERVKAELEKLQIALAENQAEIRNLYQNFSEQHSRDLGEYESGMYRIESTVRDLRALLSGKKEDLRKLGQVNLMAPEEFSEVRERYQFLTGQLEDLKKASNDLVRVTEEIRAESTERFLETYNAIRKNFHMMFRRLFGGGRAELKLTEPDKVLESGIDIFAQPPGKKLESINLLSGGEKSLTAIGLLFSTYMVKPSPFCILDEIDAALDEQNVIRLVNLLKEFARNSQFIVITHNKKTVACANTLLGVTMEESGISKLVTLRLEKNVEEKTSA